MRTSQLRSSLIWPLLHVWTLPPDIGDHSHLILRIRIFLQHFHWPHHPWCPKPAECQRLRSEYPDLCPLYSSLAAWIFWGNTQKLPWSHSGHLIGGYLLFCQPFINFSWLLETNLKSLILPTDWWDQAYSLVHISTSPSPFHSVPGKFVLVQSPEVSPASDLLHMMFLLPPNCANS